MSKFQIFDPYLNTTFIPTIGPYEGGQPPIKKAFTVTPTAAQDGLSLISEGARPPREFTWKIKILSLAQRDLWIAQLSKPYQLFVTNDLSEAAWVLLDSIDWTRTHVVSHQIKLDATIHGYELNVA